MINIFPLLNHFKKEIFFYVLGIVVTVFICVIMVLFSNIFVHSNILKFFINVLACSSTVTILHFIIFTSIKSLIELRRYEKVINNNTSHTLIVRIVNVPQKTTTANGSQFYLLSVIDEKENKNLILFWLNNFRIPKPFFDKETVKFQVINDLIVGYQEL